MPPSLVSEVLRGNRKLTEESTLKLADGLDLRGTEREYLLLLVQLERAKSPSVREVILESIRQARPHSQAVHDLGVDRFRMIADWYHFAILRLAEISTFDWTPAEAAKALGIHEYELETALRRMERLELIQIDESGRPKKITQDLLVSSPVPNEALQKYHAQMLNMTAEALKNQPPQERFTGTEDLVIDAEQLDEVKAIFEDCFNRVLACSKKNKGRKSEVFHLGIHFFRLSKLHPSPVPKKGKKQ